MTTPALADDLHTVLARTDTLWQSLRGGRVFVTGGTGFVGRWVLELLAAADRAHGLKVRVVLLTRDPQSFAARAPYLAAWSGLELLRGDVRDFALPAGTFEHILHVATVPTPPTEGRQILDLALRGTRRVLELASLAGTQRLLLVSSGAVYGPQPPELRGLSEDRDTLPPPLRASSANAVGKRAAELMAVLEGEARAFEATVARGFALIGPYLPLNGQFAAGNFLRDALTGGPVLVRGDGTPVRTYLYAADLAEWLWTIHLRGRGGTAYNVGGCDEISIGNLARLVAQVAAEGQRSPLAVEIAGTPNLVQPADRYVPDVARAAADLNLVPTVGVEECIRRTLRFLRASRG